MKLAAWFSERRITREDRRNLRIRFPGFAIPEFTRIFDDNWTRRRMMTAAGSAALKGSDKN